MPEKTVNNQNIDQTLVVGNNYGRLPEFGTVVACDLQSPKGVDPDILCSPKTGKEMEYSPFLLQACRSDPQNKDNRGEKDG